MSQSTVKGSKSVFVYEVNLEVIFTKYWAKCRFTKPPKEGAPAVENDRRFRQSSHFALESRFYLFAHWLKMIFVFSVINTLCPDKEYDSLAHFVEMQGLEQRFDKTFLKASSFFSGVKKDSL